MRENHNRRWGMFAAPLAAVAVLAVALLSPAARAAPEPYDWGAPMMWGWGWSGMWLGPFFMLLVLALVIVAIALAVRWFAGPWTLPTHHGSHGRNALDILNERYARGEIDQAEYESKRRMILQS